MKSTRNVLMLLAVLCCGLGLTGWAQGEATDAGRKILRKVQPAYPEIAKELQLAGTVKVVAVVAADGGVKKVETLGGNPVLVQAAISAIVQWKYAPGGESREPIELHFNP
jgi:TonB family protein